MKNERGFTLIELLVVIGILAVLFGLTALALTGVGADAEAKAAQAEADMVQTAIDVHMTIAEVSTITAATTAETAGDAAGSSAGFDTYLRRTTRYFFTWTAAGEVTQACKESACTNVLWP